MSDLPPLERQWAILRMLTARRYGATLRELAQEFDVCERTIRRDLNALRKVGFRIVEHKEEHGRNRWKADPDPSASQLAFNPSELAALWVSRSFLQPLAGTLFWESIQSALRKVRTTLSEASLKYVDKLAGILHQTAFRTSRYHDHAQIIDDLMVAIEDRRISHITYHSARSTEPLTYDVYPYGLVHHRGSLYLVANSCQHNEVRTFKIDRLLAVELDNLKFPPPADFHLADYLRHSLGIFHDDSPPRRIVVRFAPDVARYVSEHHWHHSQKLSPQKDGSLRAEFHLTALSEIKSWILSFGAKATVEEPEELRQTIRKELVAMSSEYVRQARTRAK